MTLRQNIRQITDRLGPTEWAKAAQIYDELPDHPKPTRAYLQTSLTTMTRAQQMRRRRAPKGSGKGVRYVFRSGRKPVIDARKLPKPKRRSAVVGFMELRRRERKRGKRGRG